MNRAVRVYGKTAKVNKKITSDDIKNTSILKNFLETIGCKTQITIYKKNSSFYINSDFIMDLLNIRKFNFSKVSIIDIHYIMIGQKIYISKYGITKLLANSNEPISYKLQDYIYEVLYKLEVNSVISKHDIVSRSALCGEIDTMNDKLTNTIDELNNYKLNADISDEVISKKLEYIQEIDKTNSTLHCTISILEKKINKLELENKSLYRENEKLMKISKRLNKCITAISIKNIIKNTKDNDVMDICKDAINAKETYKKISKDPMTSKGKRISLYYVVRSIATKIIDNCYVYQWNICDFKDLKQYQNEFDLDHYKINSENYLIGKDLFTKHKMIYYSCVYLEADSYKIISKMFDMLSYTTGENIDALLNIITDI